jgi:D-3-phosphoglycerate dehydrogenase
MGRFRVVVTDDRFGSYREENAVLSELDCQVEVLDLARRQDGDALLADADGILVNLHPLPAPVIRRLARCRVISRYGVGWDNVDVEAATAAGIWVARVPDYCTEDVSDHALALLLACVRRIPFVDRRVREGGWNLRSEQPARRIAGKTLGIVGYGRSGRALHRKVSGLGLARVLVCDPYKYPRDLLAEGAEPADLPTILAEADFLSLHVPLNPETRHLLGPAALARLRPQAILINTSRGPVVDEKALAEALAVGRLAYAGLDVFEQEPIGRASPLAALGNVVLSDHTGYYSEESLVELKTKAARNVAAVLQGGEPPYPVNRPPPRPGN